MQELTGKSFLLMVSSGTIPFCRAISRLFLLCKLTVACQPGGSDRENYLTTTGRSGMLQVSFLTPRFSKFVAFICPWQSPASSPAWYMKMCMEEEIHQFPLHAAL